MEKEYTQRQIEFILVEADRFSEEGLEDESKRLRILVGFQKKLERRDVILKIAPGGAGRYITNIVSKTNDEIIGRIEKTKWNSPSYYPLKRDEVRTESSKYFKLQSHAVEYILNLENCIIV